MGYYPTWNFGSLPCLRRDEDGEVIMISQTQKYLYIDVANYWGYITFACLNDMFSD